MSAEIVQMPSKDLAKHEKVIADGLRTFVDVGRSLAAIQEEKLYKAAGFETFEAYCRDKWDLKKRRAYQLIEAADVVQNFAQKELPPPSTESHAAALAKLKEPKQQAKAWAKAVKTAPNGTPTAKHVASVVTEMLPKPAEKPKPRVHECPQHHCKFDDGQECPVCKDRREKGLDAEPQAEVAPDVEPADLRDDDDDVVDVEPADRDSDLLALDDDIRRHMTSWQWDPETFVAALEGWCRRARAHFEYEQEKKAQ